MMSNEETTMLTSKYLLKKDCKFSKWCMTEKQRKY